MVSHNGKNRIVFNCSYTYKNKNLKKLLLPGPTLSSSLLGVLLRFREHAIGISSDIKGMFHQVRLLPEDKPLLRFLWRDLNTEEPPNIYTCLTSVEETHHLVDKLTSLLTTGGFELRQWGSNNPEFINHLPKEARSESSELWINESGTDPQELALGLRWLCNSDTLRYKYRMLDKTTPTMRNIYRVLARLYDPLGFIVPFTTRAKVLVQHLWDKQRDCDDPSLPEDVLQSWLTWEEELEHLSQIILPRCYVSLEMDSSNHQRDLHIFADASEKAYGSVAYLRTESSNGGRDVSFVAARSRVAPKKQQSIPRLELCAALTAAQLAALLQRELTVNIRNVVFWTDSTTVLAWLQSDSCRYKVFVGTRV
nr:uncharacterized protein LOC129426051 [Misgurnus anguillicaudatus]